MIDSYLVLHETVGVLSDSKWGYFMTSLGVADSSVNLCRTWVVRSRSELVVVSQGLISDTNPSSQGWHHIMRVLVPSGSIQMPTVPMMEVLQNPKWVGITRMISSKWMGRASDCFTSVGQSPTYWWNSSKIQALSSSHCFDVRCRWYMQANSPGTTMRI